MREILFRGKMENGEWLYGFYHNETSIESPSSDRKVTRHHIYTQDFDKFVIPETVGQFTGLTDKNGKKIFEGDIVKVTYIEKREYMGVKYDNEYSLIEQVCYSIEKACYMLCIKYDDITMFRPIHNFENLVTIKNLEVIGNIHDNPELLEAQK